MVSVICIRSLGLTCCEMEKPIIISPSGTSQDTVAESARRFMTDTLTGAGGRSGGEETETERSVNLLAFLDIKLSMPPVSTLRLQSRYALCWHSELTTGVCVELKVNRPFLLSMYIWSGLWMNLSMGLGKTAALSDT